jgi:hypothetical protein
VARREKVVLSPVTATPDRANSVDHVPGGQIAGGRRFRVAGLAPTEPAALLEDRRPAGAVDRAVHASAAEERRVRGIHDRVDLLLRDVALDEDDPVR